MNTLELIQKLEQLICPPDYLKYSKPICSDSMACITNGHIAILFNCDAMLPDWNHDSQLIRQVEPMLKPGKSTTFSIPDITPEPYWLEPNKTESVQCSTCNGEGVVVCEYDHEHDCPDCDGEGSESRRSIDKWQYTTPEQRYYSTETGLFDRHYLWILLELAKHRKLAYSIRSTGPGVTLCFEFEDGYGGLMSVLDRTKAA